MTPGAPAGEAKDARTVVAVETNRPDLREGAFAWALSAIVRHGWLR